MVKPVGRRQNGKMLKPTGRKIDENGKMVKLVGARGNGKMLKPAGRKLTQLVKR